MKPSAWLLMLTVILVSVTLSVTALSSPSVILGDLNRDGTLDSADIREMLRYMVGDRSLTAGERVIADCDGNTRVDTRDVRYVLEVLTQNLTQSTVTTTTTTLPTGTTTTRAVGGDGYYDEIVRP